MASDGVSGTVVSWNQKFSDFTVALESGEKVKVHRHVLAKESDVFDAMLTQDTRENQNKEMSLEHWDEATAISFLEYLYSGSVEDPQTIERLKAAFGPNEYIFRRSFDHKKLTVELLKMADMYQVEDLKNDCTEYLKKNLSDENVLDVWMGTRSLDNESLSVAVTKHLANRPLGKTVLDIPGFDEALQSQNPPLKDLVEILSQQVMRMNEDSEFLHCSSLHCPAKPNCKSKVSMAKLLDHIDKDHEAEDFIDRGSGPEISGRMTVPDEAFYGEFIWKPAQIKFENQHFFLEKWRSAAGVWCVWLYMLGTPKKCQEYRYTIKLIRNNNEDAKRELSYSGPVISMELSKGKVGEHGDCLTFTDAVAKQFWVNDEIEYNLNIQSLV